MARNSILSPMNVVSVGVGAAIAVGAVYYTVRFLRGRRLHALEAGSGMTDLRRASRDAGRAAVDATTQLGKNVGRATRDAGHSLKELGNRVRTAGKEAVQEVGYEASHNGDASRPL